MNRSRRIRMLSAVAACAACCAATTEAAQLPQPTSENTIRLRLMLRTAPEADTNGDGILTREEARSFLELKQSKVIGRVARGEKPVPTYSDVSYGPHARHKLDLWIVKSEEPTPLVVYFHGGGFVAGDKVLADADIVEACLKAGFSVAAANYRFTRHAAMPKPLHDGARAVQFLRHNAENYNIDPERIACYGESAGAVISMWLGYHDDLADPDNPDPVLRESTRLTCVGQIDGQATLDPIRVRGILNSRAYRLVHWFDLYHVNTLDELDDPKRQTLYDEVSPINHISRDDPPTFMYYHLPENVGKMSVLIAIHHPKFGFMLQEALDRNRVENVYRNRTIDGPDGEMEMVKFFRKHLGRKREAAAPQPRIPTPERP